MTEFYGADIALELLPGLAHHNVQAIELTKLEPDLDINVHHGNVPIAIVVIKAIGQIGWAHVAAIVDGWGVVLDGPVDTGNNMSVHPKSQADIDGLIAAIDRIATPWLADHHEDLGVADATLAVRIMLRRLDPQMMYRLYISSGSRGPDGFVSANRDNVRWPASVSVQREPLGGIRLTTSGSVRVIRTIAELMSGFEATELPPIKADVAWSAMFIDRVQRAKAVAQAVLARAKGRLLDHQLSLSCNAESYFTRTTAASASISVEGKSTTVVWFEGVDNTVHITCPGGLDLRASDPRGAEAAIDDIMIGIHKGLTVATAGTLREGRRYRVKLPMAGANTGDIVTFRGVQDQRVVEVWMFDKEGGGSFGIDDQSDDIGRLGDFLEPVL